MNSFKECNFLHDSFQNDTFDENFPCDKNLKIFYQRK